MIAEGKASSSSSHDQIPPSICLEGTSVQPLELSRAVRHVTYEYVRKDMQPDATFEHIERRGQRIQAVEK